MLLAWKRRGPPSARSTCAACRARSVDEAAETEREGAGEECCGDGRVGDFEFENPGSGCTVLNPPTLEKGEQMEQGAAAGMSRAEQSM